MTVSVIHLKANAVSLCRRHFQFSLIHLLGRSVCSLIERFLSEEANMGDEYHKA